MALNVGDISTAIDQRDFDPGCANALRHRPCQIFCYPRVRHNRDLPSSLNDRRRERQTYGLAQPAPKTGLLAGMLRVYDPALALGHDTRSINLGAYVTTPGRWINNDRMSRRGCIGATECGLAQKRLFGEAAPLQPAFEVKLLRVLAIRMN